MSLFELFWWKLRSVEEYCHLLNREVFGRQVGVATLIFEMSFSDHSLRELRSRGGCGHLFKGGGFGGHNGLAVLFSKMYSWALLLLKQRIFGGSVYHKDSGKTCYCQKNNYQGQHKLFFWKVLRLPISPEEALITDFVFVFILKRNERLLDGLLALKGISRW